MVQTRRCGGGGRADPGAGSRGWRCGRRHAIVQGVALARDGGGTVAGDGGRNRDWLEAVFSLLAELPWLSRSRSGSLLPERVPGEEWLLELLMRKKFLILVGR